MDRSLRPIVVVVASLAVACGGGGSSTQTVEERRAAFVAALSNRAWTACVADGPDGARETVAFTGATVELRSWRHPGSTSCGGLPILDDEDTKLGTFVVGEPVQVPDPDGSGTVEAFELDVTFGGDLAKYTIAWIDASASPAPTLYIGDDSPPNTGESPALRPTTLQVDRPHVRGAIPPASPLELDGAYSVCRNDGGSDFAEVIAFDGQTFASRLYVHATEDGSCGGHGLLNATRAGGSFDGTFTLGATGEAAIGLGKVRATTVDATVAGDAAPSLYSILWVDSWATTRTLHMGDDSGGLGDSPATRPTTLQTLGRYVMPAPAALPGVLQGSWASCTFETDRYELEVFTFAGTDLTISTYVAAIDDPKCSNPSPVPTQTITDTFTLGATAAATLGELEVTATHLDLPTLDLHGLLYVDPYASTPTLYLTDAKVPGSTVLQESKPRYLGTLPGTATLLDALSGTTLSGAKWWPNGLASAGVAGGEAMLGVAMDEMEPFATNAAQYGSGVNVNAGGQRVTTLRGTIRLPTGAVTASGSGADARASLRLMYGPPSKRLTFPYGNEDALILDVGLRVAGGTVKAYRQINHCDNPSCSTSSTTGITLADPAGWSDVGGAAGVLKVADAAYDTVYTVEVRLAESEGTKGILHWSISGGAFGAGVAGTADPATYLGSEAGWSGVPLSGGGFLSATLGARVSDRSAGGGGSARITARFDDVFVATNDGAAAAWDDFSGSGGNSGPTELSLARWANGGQRSIGLPGGALAMSQSLTSAGSPTTVGQTLQIANPAAINAVAATLRLASATVPAGGGVVAGLRGRFFNDGTGTVTGSATGDVLGIISLQVATSEVGWSLLRCTNANCGTSEAVAVGTLAGAVVDDQPHQVRIGWNPARARFTLGYDGTSLEVDPADPGNLSPVSAAGPARAPLRDIYTSLRVTDTAGESAAIDLRVGDVYTVP